MDGSALFFPGVGVIVLSLVLLRVMGGRVREREAGADTDTYTRGEMEEMEAVVSGLLQELEEGADSLLDEMRREKEELRSLLKEVERKQAEFESRLRVFSAGSPGYRLAIASSSEKGGGSAGDAGTASVSSRTPGEGSGTEGAVQGRAGDEAEAEARAGVGAGGARVQSRPEHPVRQYSEVLRLAGEGLSPEEIARRLNLGKREVSLVIGLGDRS